MARTWSTTATVPDAEILAFRTTPITQEDPDDSTQQIVREYVSLTLRWGGADYATMLWHAVTFRGSAMAVETAAATGIHVVTDGAPTAAANSIDLDGFAKPIVSLLEGWRFMVWPDPTIYRISADYDFTPAAPSLLVAGSSDKGDVQLDKTNREAYFTAGIAHYKVSYDGGTATELTTSIGAGFGMAIDAANDWIYCTVYTAGYITKMHMDGTSVTSVINTGLNNPYGIAVYSGYLYWCSAGDGKIKKAATSGGTVTDVLTGLTDPRHICIDGDNSYIYFTENTGGKIIRCSLTGTGKTTLVTAATAMGLDIDVDGDLLYYTRIDTDTLYSHALDGTGSSTAIVAANIENPKGLAIDADEGVAVLAIDADKDIVSVPLVGLGNNAAPVTPAVTAGTAALGDNAPVYFFLPKNIDGQRRSGDGDLNAIEMELGFYTTHTTIQQPEDDL